MTRLLPWARRWGISVASFAGGLVVLFVFRRGLPHVGWIVGYLVLLWLVFAVLTHLRQALEARGRRRVLTAADYAVQTLYHGVLLFVLPAYWASTTLTSPNALFLALLVVLALVATVDPWYRALVGPRLWLNHLFLLVSVFAGLNVALPLVGAPPFGALLLSAWVAVVALTPGVRRVRAWSWMKALQVTLVGALGAVSLAALGRALVPPAPLALASATLARDVVDHEPVGRVTSPVRVADLRAHGLVAHTAVHAPAGLRQPIEHVWRLRGRVVDVMKLVVVRGGRRPGFRLHSRKVEFPSDPVGRWTVDVVTSSGQLVGRLSFQVVP